MPYYKVILCDGDTETPLSMNNAPVLPVPQKGESWPVWIDGKQVYYEVVELGDLKWGYDKDGNDILYQDLRVSGFACKAVLIQSPNTPLKAFVLAENKTANGRRHGRRLISPSCATIPLPEMPYPSRASERL